MADKTIEDANGNSELTSLVSMMLYGFIALVAVVVGGLLMLAFQAARDAPRRAHVVEVQEAACAKAGLVRRNSTKYTPVLCAFRMDDEGNRIPFEN